MTVSRRTVLTGLTGLTGITAGLTLPLLVVEAAEAKRARGVIATKKVPVGGGVVIPAKNVVVTQPTPGRFHVFSAICTHQGCTVGTVEDGVIECPCHGSEYSARTGHVLRGPAPRALAKRSFTIKRGRIVLT